MTESERRDGMRAPEEVAEQAYREVGPIGEHAARLGMLEALRWVEQGAAKYTVIWTVDGAGIDAKIRELEAER